MPKTGAMYFSFIKKTFNCLNYNYFLLFIRHSQVEGTLEFPGIAAMLSEGGGELMSTIQRSAGTEEEITVPVRIQDSLQARPVRHTNRPGRQPGVQIGVIWGIIFQMLVEDPVESVTKTKRDSRISL